MDTSTRIEVQAQRILVALEDVSVYDRERVIGRLGVEAIPSQLGDCTPWIGGPKMLLDPFSVDLRLS